MVIYLYPSKSRVLTNAVDNFIRDLLVLPAEREIIREAVYGSSKVLNGDRLSEEWLRRRKLADKGIVEPAADLNSPVIGDKQNSGWNEVAKKGPVKEESPAAAAFKVVAKKKGRK
jgi:PERQ amino acid-rich with GYF domain-containing protein